MTAGPDVPPDVRPDVPSDVPSAVSSTDDGATVEADRAEGADRPAGNARVARSRVRRRATGGRPADQPVSPRISRDEQNVGWGDPAENRDDWYERERPPHHEG